MTEQPLSQARLQRALEAVEHDVPGALADAACGVASLIRFADGARSRPELLDRLPQLEQLAAHLQSLVGRLKGSRS